MQKDIKTTLRDFAYILKKNPSTIVGGVLVLLFILGSLMAPLISAFDPVAQDIPNKLLPPLAKGHLFGTDSLGRDLFARILYGGRISLLVGVVSVSIAVVVGGVFGLVSAYVGGWVDKIFMRFIDILLALPYILLTIVIVSLLGPSLFNAMIAIGISQLPTYARIMRSSVLVEKQEDYILAERSIGVSHIELMFGSILPNCLAPIIVQASLGIGGAILSAAGLSFLGLGAQPPTPEWGLMIATSRQYITSAWWVVSIPGLAILFSVLGFNLIGDGLRDILDPKLRD